MSNYQIVRAEKEHLAPLAAILRPSDRREVWAMHRVSPYEALTASLNFSHMAWTGFVEERPVLMWGVGPVERIFNRDSNDSKDRKDSKVGAPWLLSSGEAERKVPLVFLRNYRRFVQVIQSNYQLLENHVHGANDIAIRWLRWGGFTVETSPEIINGETFYRFWRKS